ncbi:MAG: hypothetical protein IPN69_12775 [Acidobacteria bacterium]|nr:hypothetical protein [Acidobacteriota bacterium]
MRRFTSIFVLLGLVLSAILMSESQESRRQSFERIDSRRPSVFLSFERLESNEGTLVCERQEKEFAILKFHNNTRELINLDANFDVREVNEVPLKLSDGASGIAVKDGSKVSLCYDVEPVLMTQTIIKRDADNRMVITQGVRVPVEVPDQNDACSCRSSARKRRSYPGIWVGPGESVTFPVPKRFLSDTLQISTAFNFEFESSEGWIRNDEPRHFVYFTADSTIRRDSR